MTIRIKHKVWVNISLNTDMTDLVYGPGETDRAEQTDTYDQHGGGSINIADSDNEDLSLVDVTNIHGIYLEVDQDVSVKLNGSADAIPLKRANTTAGSKAKLFLEGTLTQINIVNASGSAVSGHYTIWGSST